MDIDYYVGRGDAAEYLGTARARAEPPATELFQSLSEQEFTEDNYRLTALDLIDTTRWPHEKHDDSSDTAWTYVYDKGSVYVYRYGVEMQVIRCNTHRTVKLHDGVGHGRTWRPVNRFPRIPASAAR